MSKITTPLAETTASAGRTLAERICHLGDFTEKLRVLVISGNTVVIATAGTSGGVALLVLVRLCTNPVRFGGFALGSLQRGQPPLRVAAVAVPVVDRLIVVVIARSGFDNIANHGIPEGIETILLGRSQLDKVAILKPPPSPAIDSCRLTHVEEPYGDGRAGIARNDGAASDGLQLTENGKTFSWLLR